jgi:hypothetical protein
MQVGPMCYQFKAVLFLSLNVEGSISSDNQLVLDLIVIATN